MLVDVTRCAKLAGVSKAFVSAVKGQPDSPFSGRYTTLEKFEAWVLAHPNFNLREYQYRRKQDLELYRKLDRIAGTSFTTRGFGLGPDAAAASTTTPESAAKPIVTEDPNRLLNCRQCSRVTGFGRSFISAVKAQPDTPFHGRYVTRHDFETWVKNHPNFRSSHHWRNRKAELAKAQAARNAGTEPR